MCDREVVEVRDESCGPPSADGNRSRPDLTFDHPSNLNLVLCAAVLHVPAIVLN
jgi:hypothetical protein